MSDSTSTPAPRDIAANRARREWTRGEQARRVAWALVSPFFKFSPRPLWGVRRAMLRAFGAEVGAHVHVHPTVRIAIPWTLSLGNHTAIGDRAILYGLGSIRIGERVTISQGAHLCAGTHDWRDPTMPLVKSQIEIGDDTWICADAFVGPDVTVGARSILGARACLMRDLQSGHMAYGNPAKAQQIRDRPIERTT